MAASADPLRNTLDHLALDPAGKQDRKYLVSMLRRLGYSEREIQKAVGGERIIEIEYTGSGRVPSRPREDAFEVVSENEQFSLDNDFDTVEEWTEEWPEDEPELVEFKERAQDDGPVGFSVTKRRNWESVEDPAVAAGWVPVDEEDIGAPAAPPGDSWEPTTGEGGWEDDSTWEAPAEDDEWGAADEDWEPFTDKPETIVEFKETEPKEAEADEWEAVDETGSTWEADDAAPAWEEETEPVDEIDLQETDQDDWKVKPIANEPEEAAQDDPWKPKSDVSRAAKWLEEDHEFDDGPEEDLEPEAPVPAAPDVVKAEKAVDQIPDEGYQYGEYTLYTRTVELSTGRKQRIYFFAKGDPKSGMPAPLPAGYVVEKNQRTGLPFLRRNTDEPVEESPVEETTEEVRCHAVTKGGTQCKNGARENSKYCGTHKGWRGTRVD